MNDKPFGSIRLKDGAVLTFGKNREWVCDDEDHPGEVLQATLAWKMYRYSPSHGMPYRHHIISVAEALGAEVSDFPPVPDQKPGEMY